MAKLTQAGKELLDTLKARQAEAEAQKAAALQAEAQCWAKERVARLAVELKTEGMGDALCILSLTGRELKEGDELKITALDKALGIDIMSEAEIQELNGDHDWAVAIIVEDLMKLLEAAAED